MADLKDSGVKLETGLRVKFRNGSTGILLNDVGKIILKDGFVNNPIGHYRGNDWDLVAVYERPLAWKDIFHFGMTGRKIWDEYTACHEEALKGLREKIAAKENLIEAHVKELETMRDSATSIERVIKESLN